MASPELLDTPRVHARGFSWVRWAEILGTIARDKCALEGNATPGTMALYDAAGDRPQAKDLPSYPKASAAQIALDLRILAYENNAASPEHSHEALHDQDLADLAERDKLEEVRSKELRAAGKVASFRLKDAVIRVGGLQFTGDLADHPLFDYKTVHFALATRDVERAQYRVALTPGNAVEIVLRKKYEAHADRVLKAAQAAGDAIVTVTIGEPNPAAPRATVVCYDQHLRRRVMARAAKALDRIDAGPRPPRPGMAPKAPHQPRPGEVWLLKDGRRVTVVSAVLWFPAPAFPQAQVKIQGSRTVITCPLHLLASRVKEPRPFRTEEPYGYVYQFRVSPRKPFSAARVLAELPKDAQYAAVYLPGERTLRNEGAARAGRRGHWIKWQDFDPVHQLAKLDMLLSGVTGDVKVRVRTGKREA